MHAQIIDLSSWEARWRAFLLQHTTADAAHDLEHTRRVVVNAQRLAQHERADLAVVLPAAWLHDCVVVPKDSPLRAQASTLAAEAAGAFLRTAGYPRAYIPAIEHAIAAHSFSAGIIPQSVEARIVQDADRLDALGAVGIARTLMLGAVMGRPLYAAEDPFAIRRPPDDTRSSIDHFYTKLLRLAATMQTAVGRREAEQRTAFMHTFLEQLAAEIAAPQSL